MRAITDDVLTGMLIEALCPVGAPVKYSEIVGYIADQTGEDRYTLYGLLGPILQRLKRDGKVEYVKGAGSGWRRRAAP